MLSQTKSAWLPLHRDREQKQIPQNLLDAPQNAKQAEASADRPALGATGRFCKDKTARGHVGRQTAGSNLHSKAERISVPMWTS